MSDSHKLYLDTIADPAEETISQVMRDARQEFTRDILRLREGAVRDALIALGWTPPPPRLGHE